MAPALTEPLSPTENLTKSAVTATTTPTTRSSRKLESSLANNNRSGLNTTNCNTATTNTREKRNRSGGAITNQTPTTSKRITRSRDNQQQQQRSLANTPTSSSSSPSSPLVNGVTATETLQGNTITRKLSKLVVESAHEIGTSIINSTNSTNTNSSCTKNEQMGLSTAPLNNNNKNKILNNNNNNINSTSPNLDTIKDNTKDTSTAQLLADLTNEAITAEICLRNQLKDVNLVKTSGDPSSPIIQQEEDTYIDSDIVVLKSVAASSPSIVAAKTVTNKTTTAHMEAQLNELTKSSKVHETTSEAEAAAAETTTATTNEAEINTTATTAATSSSTTATTATEEKELNSLEENKTQEIVKENDENSKEDEELLTEVNSNQCTEDDHGDDHDEHKNEKSPTENFMDTANDAAVHETPLGSPNSCEDVNGTKKSSSSKLEILSVQELPPVSTDSTMTASEVEDNLEERLSQLDGTAIDSPPPNNHELDTNEKINQNSVTTATPPRTPTHQQSLSHDLQELQQQLQHTPPTPVAQQVQTNQQLQLQLQQQQTHQQQHQQMQMQLQHQQPHTQPQQVNCFNTPQSTSTSSSMNAMGTVGNMTENVVGGTAEFEDQDIEEVFKVLKGFEGGTTSDLNVCDLNVLFNEVYMKMNETELSGNAGGGGAISTNSQSHIAITNPSIQLVKPTQMEEGQLEMEKRQQQMQRKIDFLMRRLRKLQARYMCKHTSEEIAGLFEWSARQASKGVTNATALQQSDSAGAVDPAKCFLKVIAARPPASDWKDVNESLVPANQISTLLRKIESVANAQQLCTTPTASLVNIPHKKTKKAMMEAQAASNVANSASKLAHFSESKAEEVVVATLEENVTDELSQVAGLLQTEMSEVQKAIDSDATESSSGGESADEMVTYNNTQQQTLPITKRAAWRYSRDRAAIASRWSWLLSQISDLEIKIRQHSELHQEILRSKGPVTCDNTTTSTTTEQGNEELMGSCRTRGYVPSLFRKRKLIQTTNIHTISKKAARPSTIKCGCQWPLHPCALCTGRLDPTAPRDLPDTMMMSDRIALLDSGYHPVLSFRENVNNALHFEAIAKQPEWQQRVMRCQAKNIAKNVWRAEREAVAAAAGGHHSSSSKKYGEAPPAKRRYIKKKDRLNNTNNNNNNNDEGKTGGKNSHSTTATTTSSGLTASSTTAAGTHSITAATTATSLNDVGNGTATSLSTSSTTTTSTTPLVANSKLLGQHNQECEKTKQSIDEGREFKGINDEFSTTTNSNIYINNDDNTQQQQQQQQIYTSNERLSPNKLRSIQSQPNTFIIDLQSPQPPPPPPPPQQQQQQQNNSLYNGDSNYMYNHEIWGGAATGDNFNVRSRTSSPTHGSSGNNYHKYERSLDRKNRTSYDIDNIVIPYSVAAATRVEILPYKEIPTPKWRVIENDNEESNKLKCLKNHNTVNETSSTSSASSECKALTNGLVNSDDNVKTDHQGDCEEDKETKNSKESDCKLEKQNENNTSSEDKILKNSNHLLVTETEHEDKDTKLQKSRDNNDGDDDRQEQDGGAVVAVAAAAVEDGSCDVVDEPELKKPKLESSVIDNVGKEEEEKNPQNQKVIEEKEKDKKDATKQEKLHEMANVDDEEKLALQNCSKVSVEEEEDISDDAMFLRHERALTEERRKFQTYLKFPWSTRSRANRRIDSRAESSGANTPDPSSPAPQTPSVGGGDLESIPSPLNPATPMNPLDTNSEAGDNSTSFLGVGPLPSLSSKRYERRRTTSSKRDREVERRSSTPDSKELIPPYEPLTFPLTDEQFEELLRAMPSDHSEDSKRFDDCYLPGGGAGLGGILNNKHQQRTTSTSTSKRTSRASTMCGDAITTATTIATSGGGSRRTKGAKTNKSLRPISADDSNENGGGGGVGDMLLYDEDYDDDYPKHHLAPNDDHLTADSVNTGHVTARGFGASSLYDDDDDDDVYGDQYGAYVGRQQRKHQRDSEAETSDEEPFQDDDPNDPEWRGEHEERLRKKM